MCAHAFRRLVGCLVLLVALSGCGASESKTAGTGGAGSEITIAMMPKLVNIDYFDACHRGAKKAADELSVKLIYNGPTEPSGAAQNQFMDTWIRQGVDVICVAPNQPQTIRKFVEKARDAGIHVLTWDTDAPESGREWMVNQVDDKRLGEMLMDDLAAQMGEEGEWAVVIASLDAANLNTWRDYAEKRAAEKYPKLRKVDTVVTNEDETEARQKVETLLNARPEIKGLIAFDSNSVPGAAEALKRSGKAGKVALTGNSTPGKMKTYINEGVLQSFYLWDPRELGALTVRVAKAVAEGKAIGPETDLGGHGKLTVSDRDPHVIIMSDPIRFTKENIEQYDFGF